MPSVWSLDADALRHNYRWLAQWIQPKKIFPVIKTDAYGLGALSVATLLLQENVTAFFMGSYQEAQELAPHLPRETHLYVLHGFDPILFSWHVNIFPVISDSFWLKKWAHFSQAEERKVPVMLQWETGLNRLGLRMDTPEWWDPWRLWISCLEVRCCLSHMANVSDSIKHQQQQQFQRIQQTFIDLKRWSLSASSSVGERDWPHEESIRIGRLLYGCKHAQTPQDICKHIRPVLTAWYAHVLSVQTVLAGEGIGYGHTYQAEKNQRIAIIDVGYAHGLNALPDFSVWIQGTKVPIVGSLSMDMATIDVTEIEHVVPGTRVDFFGPGESLLDWQERYPQFHPSRFLTQVGSGIGLKKQWHSTT